ncbi:MAG: L-fucose mutarotase [Verrucomicrobia bacterium]|nr:L-fucose mutarotase [Verrucomicrobiota bacterium]
MLRGISPLISPDLLDALYRMGHGDELVLADAHFPSESLGRRVVRADGLPIADLLDAILPLLALDTFVESPLFMMEPVPGDSVDPSLIDAYRAAISRHCTPEPPITLIERFAFYERVKAQGFAVVATGETAKYGNIILKKGVTPVANHCP